MNNIRKLFAMEKLVRAVERATKRKCASARAKATVVELAVNAVNVVKCAVAGVSPPSPSAASAASHLPLRIMRCARADPFLWGERSGMVRANRMGRRGRCNPFEAALRGGFSISAIVHFATGPAFSACSDVLSFALAEARFGFPSLARLLAQGSPSRTACGCSRATPRISAEDADGGSPHCP